VAFVQRLRKMDLFKLPGVAETIDWSKALVALDKMTLDPQTVNDTLGTLLKYQDDIVRVRGSDASACSRRSGRSSPPPRSLRGKKTRIPSLEAGRSPLRARRAQALGALNFTLRGGELLRSEEPTVPARRASCALHAACSSRPAARCVGAVKISGGCQEEFWRRLVYVGHANAIKDDLTAAENLYVAYTLAGTRVQPARIVEALRRLGLAVARICPCGAVAGAARRTALARLALSEAMPLWILDEPFAALDAAGCGVRAEFGRGARLEGRSGDSHDASRGPDRRATQCIDLGAS